MEKEKKIAILMYDYCTKQEAEKHLKNGTEVYPESEKETYVSLLVSGLVDEQEAVEAWENLPEVEYNGEKFKIDYIL